MNTDSKPHNCVNHFSYLPHLFCRLSLLFMPVKYHPSEPYVRRVQAWKMHVYTLVQVLALVVLWAVKSSQFSLAFPFFLIMMVPLRQRLSMFFNPREMNAVNVIFLDFFFLNYINLICSIFFFLSILFSSPLHVFSGLFNSWMAKIHRWIQVTSLISMSNQ